MFDVPMMYPFTDGSLNRSMYGNDKYGKQRVPLVNIGNGAPHDLGSIVQNGKRLPAGGVKGRCGKKRFMIK